MTIDLKMSGDRVTAYGQTVKACLLGQAAAAIVGKHVIGASAKEFREAGAAMRSHVEGGRAAARVAASLSWRC